MFSKLLGRCDTRCAVASPVMQDSMDSDDEFISNVKSLEKISENEIRCKKVYAAKGDPLGLSLPLSFISIIHKRCRIVAGSIS